MINNIWFKIIAEKINKIPQILHDFCTEYARLHNKTTRSRPKPRGRGQNFGLETTLASRTTSLVVLPPLKCSMSFKLVNIQ